ncbi:MAG: LA2681 family HEPN domain-containing protein [Isosphaeraceae bacterium]
MDNQSYQRVLSAGIPPDLPVGEYLDSLARFIDFADAQGDPAGARHALDLVNRFRGSRSLDDRDSARLHYFEANAWGILKPAPGPDSPDAWTWHSEAIENEIRQLRLARRSSGFSKLQGTNQAQIDTNLGNALSTLGRFVEAKECFDRALEIDRAHGMARGNRGISLFTYALTLPHLPHVPGFCTTAAFFQEAEKNLKQALKLPLEGDAHAYFMAYLQAVADANSQVESAEGFAEEEAIGADLEPGQPYRSWSLENRLFLNPLNDITRIPRAACDVLHLPAFTARPEHGFLLLGLVNQMKLEFAVARLLLFEGITSSEDRFADKELLLADTLDYPALTIGVEKMRAAFRSVYSIFDKIGFFLNFYLGLGIPASEVNFRRLWLETQKRSKKLRADFESRPNWPLRGLYWLSRDLQAHKADNNAIDPDAKDLARIRNHIEHCYLRIHNEGWVASGRGQGGEATDGSSYSIDRGDFTLRAIRLLKLARSALIYLVFSVYAEEAKRGESHTATP